MLMKASALAYATALVESTAVADLVKPLPTPLSSMFAGVAIKHGKIPLAFNVAKAVNERVSVLHGSSTLSVSVLRDSDLEGLPSSRAHRRMLIGNLCELHEAVITGPAMQRLEMSVDGILINIQDGSAYTRDKILASLHMRDFNALSVGTVW